jgi:hypothetical protein
MLPDVALLGIFDFYMHEEGAETWHTLVHVCQKWRLVVFQSPRRLGVRLRCTGYTSVREMLDIWPPLPIAIESNGYMGGVGNIIEALKHNDRVCELDLDNIRSSQLDEAMQRPFPTLTRLQLKCGDESAPLLPDSFLGGSASSLQSLLLHRIPFPGLPKLLSSATRLVKLDLWDIPDTGYISPEVMAAGLSVLTRLQTFFIGFASPLYRPDRKSQCLPSLTRTLLPVLTKLVFKGPGEYLRDLVARIDAPLLDKLAMIFFHPPIFDTSYASQLTQFISRTQVFKAHDTAQFKFFNRQVEVVLLPQTAHGALHLGISCTQVDQQLSSLAQVCRSSFLQALIPMVEHLYIQEDHGWDRRASIENGQWLEVLHPFIAVKELYISYKFVPLIAPALEELVTERVTEVLPALRTIFLDETLSSRLVQEPIGRFVAARQLAGYPVAVSHWE